MPEPVPPSAPAPAVHSPNGAAILPQRWLQIAATTLAVAAAVLTLPEMFKEVGLVVVLPALVTKVCQLILAGGVVLGVISHGVRKAGTVADPSPSGSNVQLPLLGTTDHINALTEADARALFAKIFPGIALPPGPGGQS